MPDTTAPESIRIVYYGASGAGKRTNFKQLKLAVGTSESSVTTWQRDVVAGLSLSSDSKFKTALTLATLVQGEQTSLWVPVLKGVRGIVFVADSDPAKHEQNIHAMSELIGQLALYRIKIDTFPCVLQYNKRDLADATALTKCEAELNPLGFPAFNAVADRGEGVLQCLEAIVHLIRTSDKRENR